MIYLKNVATRNESSVQHLFKRDTSLPVTYYRNLSLVLDFTYTSVVSLLIQCYRFQNRYSYTSCSFIQIHRLQIRIEIHFFQNSRATDKFSTTDNWNNEKNNENISLIIVYVYYNYCKNYTTICMFLRKSKLNF